MNRGMRANAFRALPVALAVVLAAPGCARFRKPRVPAPPAMAEEVGADSPEAALPAGIAGATNELDRLILDEEQVLSLQTEMLVDQHQGEPGTGVRHVTRFTQWLDKHHENLYRRMDNAVRWIDTKWLPKDMPYNHELSTFKLSLRTQIGGKSTEKDFDIKVRFRADMTLPGLERKLRLFVDNIGREELPGADPLDQTDNDTRIGARAVLKSIENIQFDVGGGVRLRSSGPVAFGELNWSGKTDWMGGVLRLHPRGYYYSNDGFGQQTELSWRRPTSGREILELRLVEKATEKTEGMEFEQTLRYCWPRSGRGRGWVAQASLFPHYKDSQWYWSDALVNVTWRDAMYRKWIYYTLTPQLQFPEDSDYEARPSLRISGWKFCSAERPEI